METFQVPATLVPATIRAPNGTVIHPFLNQFSLQPVVRWDADECIHPTLREGDAGRRSQPSPIGDRNRPLCVQYNAPFVLGYFIYFIRTRSEDCIDSMYIFHRYSVSCLLDFCSVNLRLFYTRGRGVKNFMHLVCSLNMNFPIRRAGVESFSALSSQERHASPFSRIVRHKRCKTRSDIINNKWGVKTQSQNCQNCLFSDVLKNSWFSMQ